MDKFSYAHDAFYGSMVGAASTDSTPAKPTCHDFVAEWLVASMSDEATKPLHPTSTSKRALNDIWHS